MKSLPGICGSVRSRRGACFVASGAATVAALKSAQSVICVGHSHTRQAFSIQMINGGWLLPISDISATEQWNHEASRVMNMVTAMLISLRPPEERESSTTSRHTKFAVSLTFKVSFAKVFVTCLFYKRKGFTLRLALHFLAGNRCLWVQLHCYFQIYVMQ